MFETMIMFRDRHISEKNFQNFKLYNICIKTRIRSNYWKSS